MVQLSGRKRWRLYAPLVRQPTARLKFKPSAAQVRALGDPVQIELRESDVLYLPRKATARLDPSTPWGMARPWPRAPDRAAAHTQSS